MTVYVNVFLAPYCSDRQRFYISMSYPTKKAAVDGLGKGKTGRKTQTYIGTFPLKLK